MRDVGLPELAPSTPLSLVWWLIFCQLIGARPASSLVSFFTESHLHLICSPVARLIFVRFSGPALRFQCVSLGLITPTSMYRHPNLRDLKRFSMNL